MKLFGSFAAASFGNSPNVDEIGSVACCGKHHKLLIDYNCSATFFYRIQFVIESISRCKFGVAKFETR